MLRKYAASLKDERTEFCVSGRDSKDCDKLARTYSAMFVAAPAKVEFVAEIVVQ
jgi:hypothetical protein